MVLLKIPIVLGLFLHCSNGTPIDPTIQDFVPHIVGGTDAPDNHSPHAMALTSGYWVNSLVCGASIISEHHVLTAAHCIEALMTWNGELTTSLRGVYGSTNWESTEKLAMFSGFVNHHDYDPRNYKNDIGILSLAEKLIPSDKWKIIPLNFNYIKPGEKCSVSGWGRLYHWGPIPTQMQYINVKTISEKNCKAGVAAAVPPGWWAPPINDEVEICTLHPKGAGKGVCNGDSGSALVSLTTKDQIGIVSWGFPCANGHPDMFVRVSAFKDFVLKTLKNHECPRPRST